MKEYSGIQRFWREHTQTENTGAGEEESGGRKEEKGRGGGRGISVDFELAKPPSSAERPAGREQACT